MKRKPRRIVKDKPRPLGALSGNMIDAMQSGRGVAPTECGCPRRRDLMHQPGCTKWGELRPDVEAAKPSPLPWRIVSVKDYILVKAPEGCRIAELRIPRGDLSNANARLIVRAVNAHAVLVASVKELKESLAAWMEIADQEDVRDYDVDALRNADAALRAVGEAV